MARKKTRAEKIKVEINRQTPGASLTYSLGDIDSHIVSTTETPLKTKKLDNSATSLITYDPVLLIKDLRKTLTLSGLIFAIEIVVYFLIRKP